MSQIRIIGGNWRSRRIAVAKTPGLRPTPDRVRETLFNWLGQNLAAWHCLDLFAGTGILGFEAASRGADRVVLVERNPQSCRILRDVSAKLNATQVTTLCADAIEFARSASSPFDLVFVDPPYRQAWLERIEPLLTRLIRPQGLLYVEAEKPLTQLGPWHTSRQGQAGQVFFHLMRKTAKT